MRGGPRQGAGRKPGGQNRKTRAIADRAAAEGITPLEVMLDNMRFFHGEAARLAQQIVAPEAQAPEQAVQMLKVVMGARQSAQDAARDAAPYMHPRLAAVEHTGKDGGPVEIKRIELVIVDPPNHGS